MTSSSENTDEKLNTLTEMFGPRWSEHDLRRALEHHQGYAERTMDAILDHGDGRPEDFLSELAPETTSAPERRDEHRGKIEALTEMFGPRWTQHDLRRALEHHQGYAERTMDAILNHGDGRPEDILSRLASETRAEKVVVENNASEEQARGRRRPTASLLRLRATSPFPDDDDDDDDATLVDVRTTPPSNSAAIDLERRLRTSWSRLTSDLRTRPEDARAVGASLNGRRLGRAQVVWFARYFHVRIRDDTAYWYDKESGLFGKVGGGAKRALDPRLNVKGALDPRSSRADTGIHLNGREITAEERANWRLLRMNLKDGERYRVDPLGDVRLETTKTNNNNTDAVLFNWRKQQNTAKKCLIGAALVGTVLCTGGLGAETVAGAGGEEAMYGSDGFFANDAAGYAGNFDSAGNGYVMFDDGSSVSVGL